MQIDKLRLSHSSRGLIKSCARKLEFRKFYECSRREESLAANVGKALHAGYQDWLLHKDKERAAFEYMLRYPFQYEKGTMDDRNLEAGYATLIALMNNSQLAEYQLAHINIDGKIVPCIEVPFLIQVENFSLDDDANVPVEYIGFMDLILYDVLNDCYVVVDIKTTRKTTQDMTPIYQFDEQCIPYAIVLERLLGKSLHNLEVKYLSAYIDILEPKVKMYDFMKSREDIHDWMRGFLIDLQNIKTFYQLQWFPRNSNGCFSWNKPCQYFDMCQTRDEKTINQILEFNTAEQLPFEPWVTLQLSFTEAA